MADVEAERAEDLQQQPEQGRVGRVGEYDDRLLLAAAGEALVLALAVEDEAVEEAAAGGPGGSGRRRVRDAEGEERVVDGGAMAREVVGHGVGEGGEGDEAVEAAVGERVGREAGLHELPSLQVEPDDAERPRPPRQRRRVRLGRVAAQRDGRDPVHPFPRGCCWRNGFSFPGDVRGDMYGDARPIRDAVVGLGLGGATPRQAAAQTAADGLGEEMGKRSRADRTGLPAVISDCWG